MTGIFDSGCGGLSVLREMLKVLPGESYVFYADNAHCPYGEKSPDWISRRAGEIVSGLVGKGCDIVVVACNTATAAAIADLRRDFSIPLVGMEPAVKPAAALTRSGVVGVPATAGTLHGEKYHITRDRYAEDVKVVEQVGRGFVELVERGCIEGPEAEAVVEESVRPLMEQGADTIVLGCTHYPFLAATIEKVARRLCPGVDVRLIDPAPAVARHYRDLRRSLPSYEDALTLPVSAYRVSLSASGDDAVLQRLYRQMMQTKTE